MRKEVILAVIIGVLLGGVILYGINLANNSSNTSDDSEIKEVKATVTPTPTKKSDNQVSIISPQNNAVVTEGTISLKGSTKPNINVAIITENDDILVKSDSAGNFSSDINLINGENLVTITVVDEKQATASSTVTVIRTSTLPE